MVVFFHLSIIFNSNFFLLFLFPFFFFNFLEHSALLNLLTSGTIILKEKELAMKEFQSLENKNKHLKAQVNTDMACKLCLMLK